MIKQYNFVWSMMPFILALCFSFCCGLGGCHEKDEVGETQERCSIIIISLDLGCVFIMSHKILLVCLHLDTHLLSLHFYMRAYKHISPQMSREMCTQTYIHNVTCQKDGWPDYGNIVLRIMTDRILLFGYTVSVSQSSHND